MNEYLNETGLDDARVEMPRAHAVSRAQINIRALHEIKTQMRQNEWIMPTGRDDRQRMLWQLTSKGQKLLESNILDSNRVFQFKTMH
jgi:predicted transcriptional regulator